MIDKKLAICAGFSFVAHYALAMGLEQLPKRVDVPPAQKITVSVVEPDKAPPPEPPKAPEPPKPEPEPPKPIPPPPEAKPSTKPVAAQPAPHVQHVSAVNSDAPPSEHAVQTTGNDEPVYGVTMQSTSQQGGTAVNVGNTLSPGTPSAPAKAAPKPAGVAAIPQFEATKLPLPHGRCFGTYTDEAKAAGTEGTVVLDLTVDETGHAREVTIVQGLDHGLSAAALTAMRGCTFSPGEKDGKPVAVRIRGFKITFVLADAR